MFKCLIAAIAFYGVDAADFMTHSEPVAGSYIIVFKKGVDAATRESHMNLYSAKNVNIDRKYSIGEHFNGYSARMDQATLSAMLNVDEVDFIEQDGVVRTNAVVKDADACESQEAATWGLVRTSEQELKITGEYVYPDTSDGAGVTSYIIDTGVYIEHDEFEGRATWGYNAVDRDDTDGNGHGTHCAGTVGGKTYGMAKKANIVGVKVLSASGSGSTAGVIDGINWVANNHKKPATANMSLGGGLSSALNAAVDAATFEGVVMVVAAGNDNRDACSYSPASSEESISVAASDNRDNRATFSNYGRCTDLFAPGVSITSAWINSPTSINTISGTSMACPHVCGQATKYMTRNTEATNAMVKAFLTSEASGGLIVNPGINSPNLLLFADCNTFGTSEVLNASTTKKMTKRY